MDSAYPLVDLQGKATNDGAMIMKVVNITANQRAAINRQVQRVFKADAAETVGT